MPSPFPGMDPYLEGHFWAVVHHELGSAIPRQLSPRLRPRYVALPVERFIRDESDLFGRLADEYPEVGISRGRPMREAGVAYSISSGGDAPLQLATLISEPIPHVSIEIYTVADRGLVTAIEILSPTNKRGRGRERYLAKRDMTLSSEAHLMEIDLLRQGERVPMKEPLPPAPYFVILSRAEKRPVYDKPPDVPLEGEAAAWADQWLQAARARR